MSSKGLYEQSSSDFRTYKDRETQTDNIYDLNNTSAKSKDGKEKLFEFCEIVQDPCDPNSVSIIKESFSEEVITETPKGSSLFSGKPTAIKYIYCREVTQPYGKTYSSECPSYVTAAKLVQKPVKEPEKPDYQSIHEVNSNNNSIKKKINSKSCISAMNSDERCKMHCKTTFINPEDTPKKCPCKTDQKKPCQNKSSATKCPPIPKCPSKENQVNESSERPKSPTCQKCYEIDELKLKSCISSCIKESIKTVKKGSATCINEMEKLIGIKHGENCEDKPTYYLLEKSKCPSFSPNDSSTNVPQRSSMQKFFDSQTQTVTAIQCALKDFIGNICTKTKEAVEGLRSESSNHLNEKPESTTDNGKVVKDCANDKTISSFIPEKIRAQINRLDTQLIHTSSESLKKLVEPAKVGLDQIASIVLSSVSVAKDADLKNIVNNIIDARFNKSSPYDTPGVSQKTPKPVSQEHEPSSNANMFNTIKSRLFSIFAQKDSQDDDDDDDDDDDLSAEKYFNKYCDL